MLLKSATPTVLLHHLLRPKLPRSGWEWRGNPPVGSPKGAWYNPGTGETLHPDLDHLPPIGHIGLDSTHAGEVAHSTRRRCAYTRMSTPVMSHASEEDMPDIHGYVPTKVCALSNKIAPRLISHKATSMYVRS